MKRLQITRPSWNIQAPAAPTEPITVFILSYNRPIYLWVCLDSLFRNTTYPVKFILADNCSTDPLVARVIEGFKRRGMLHTVHMCKENRVDRVKWMIHEHRSELGEFFGFVESDVEVMDSADGWLKTMMRLMRQNPKLWMLGSHIVKTDFVNVEAARRVDPDLPEEQFQFLLKPQSPERMVVDDRPELIEPHNPPGRLLLFRTEMLAKVPLQADWQMHQSIKALGYESKISTKVVHRHLSVLNFFDYRDYDGEQRAKFFDEMGGNQELL